MVTNFKNQRPAPLICITLLAGLSGFPICLYNTNLVLSLANHIGPKEIPFTGFRLVQWSPTPPSIQGFKGCHFDTFLIAVVVREFSEWQTLIPFLTIRKHTGPQHIFQNLINPLGLTIGLWMINRTADQLCAQSSMELFPEPCNELCSTI